MNWTRKKKRKRKDCNGKKNEREKDKRKSNRHGKHTVGSSKSEKETSKQANCSRLQERKREM